jgi:hypothetical protein
MSMQAQSESSEVVTIQGIIGTAKQGGQSAQDVLGWVFSASMMVFSAVLFLCQIPAMLIAPFLRLRIGVLTAIFGGLASLLFLDIWMYWFLGEPDVIIVGWSVVLTFLWMFHSLIAVYRVIRPARVHIHRSGSGMPIGALGRLYEICLGRWVRGEVLRQIFGEFALAAIFGALISIYAERAELGVMMQVLGWLPAFGLAAHAVVSLVKTCWARQLMLDSQLEQAELAELASGSGTVPQRDAEGSVSMAGPVGAFGGGFGKDSGGKEW